MLFEKYLIESKQFNKKLNDNENLKDAFFYCKRIEHLVFFIVYIAFVCFSFNLLNDFYSIHKIVPFIGVSVFGGIYFLIMKYNGVFKKIPPINPINLFALTLGHIQLLVASTYFVLTDKEFVSGIILSLPLFAGVGFYFINKYKSYSCSYSLIEKEEKIITAEKKKIEEIKKVILENENHKREAIDYLLDRKKNNQELNLEELKLKDIILENEGMSDHKDFFILDGIVKENNREEEVFIKNT